jgi:hypothetical protein
VREDVSPGPARQQRRRSQVRLGDDASHVDQALRRLIDLVAQLAFTESL